LGIGSIAPELLEPEVSGIVSPGWLAHKPHGLSRRRIWNSMNITLNGEPRWVDTAKTLAGLVETLGLDLRKVAVERNLEIVPRSIYAQTLLAEGDRIEIVHFIGGG